MRYRITFAKTEAMRYTSHLDTQRTWERTIRRARLPLAYSQGFNPRPKINLASALPLGTTSSCELAEIWLEQNLPALVVQDQLQDADTPGLQILLVEAVDLKAPKIPNLVVSAEYLITLIEPVEDLDERVHVILSSDSLIRDRRGKKYDLRPLIEQIEVLKLTSHHEQCFHLQLAARTGATGRPDEVLAEMEISLQNARVHRIKLILENNG